jgi:hypothetical protein
MESLDKKLIGELMGREVSAAWKMKIVVKLVLSHFSVIGGYQHENGSSYLL